MFSKCNLSLKIKTLNLEEAETQILLVIKQEFV